ncbi:MAG: hypothetical protein OHK0046_32130 [Anaerolineae bacterium]
MRLNLNETLILAWYRSLTPLEQLVLHYWLVTGDDRLLLATRERSERLQRFDYLTITDGCDEFALHRG